MASSAESTVPGMRRPGSLGDEGTERRVIGQRRCHGFGVCVEVEKPSTAGDRGGEVTDVVEGQFADDVVGRWSQGHDSEAGGEAQSSAIRAVVVLLAARDRGGDQMTEEVVGTERGPEWKTERERTRG